jgi:ABC-type spermidine/putrescine transport system permease subunit II
LLTLYHTGWLGDNPNFSKRFLFHISQLTFSFDEFALALFLAGPEPTFPVYLFSQLRFANRLPVMIALAVLLMIGTLVLVFIAERIRRTE